MVKEKEEKGLTAEEKAKQREALCQLINDQAKNLQGLQEELELMDMDPDEKEAYFFQKKDEELSEKVAIEKMTPSEKEQHLLRKAYAEKTGQTHFYGKSKSKVVKWVKDHKTGLWVGVILAIAGVVLYNILTESRSGETGGVGSEAPSPEFLSRCSMGSDHMQFC